MRLSLHVCKAVCCQSVSSLLVNKWYCYFEFSLFQYSLVSWLVCEGGGFKYGTGYSYILDEARHNQNRITPHSESPCLCLRLPLAHRHK